MAKEFRTLKTSLNLPYELAYGPIWTRFFDGLLNKKILATNVRSATGYSFLRGVFALVVLWIHKIGWRYLMRAH